MRYLSTLLILLVCAVGCQGPISDWPHSKSDDGPSSGAGLDPGGGGSIGNPVVSGPNTGQGGTGGNASPPSTGTTAGAGGGGTTAGTVGLGGLVGGAGVPSADAGISAPPGAGGTAGGSIGDAGTATSGDASAALDGGVPDAQVPDAQTPDAQVPDAASDGGCPQPSTPDASICPGYGCRTTMQQLRTVIDQEGACTSPQALAVACDGRVTNAALQCTQESAFSLNIDRAITSCLKRDPQLTMLSGDCLDCYVDEAVCTLARCFAACTIGDGSACKSCKRQQCGAPLELCTGLPAP